MRFNLLLFLLLPSLFSAQPIWKPLEKFQNDSTLTKDLLRSESTKLDIACGESMIFRRNDQIYRALCYTYSLTDTMHKDKPIYRTIKSDNSVLDSVRVTPRSHIYSISSKMAIHYGHQDSLWVCEIHPDYTEYQASPINLPAHCTAVEWSKYFSPVQDSSKIYFNEVHEYNFEKIESLTSEIELSVLVQGLDSLSTVLLRTYPDVGLNSSGRAETARQEYLNQAQYILLTFFISQSNCEIEHPGILGVTSCGMGYNILLVNPYYQR